MLPRREQSRSLVQVAGVLFSASLAEVTSQGQIPSFTYRHHINSHLALTPLSYLIKGSSARGNVFLTMLLLKNKRVVKELQVTQRLVGQSSRHPLVLLQKKRPTLYAHYLIYPMLLIALYSTHIKGCAYGV